MVRLLAGGGEPALARATPVQVVLDLFDRGDLEVPKSPRAVWDLLAILAAAIFVFDVAARRIAVDRKALSALAARTVGRRQEVGTDTVAAWKRVAQRKDQKEAAASTRYEATATDQEQAIDVAGEVSVKPGDARPPRPTREQAEPEPSPDAGDYTSRLLAAKRRAQDRSQRRDRDTPDA